MDVLLHTLGLDANHREPWRNHYVTGGTDADVDTLVAEGLMEPTRRPGFLHVDDRVYRATDRGVTVACAENRRRNPPPSRAKGRYLAWLRIADVCPDLTFGAFLKRRMYDEVTP